MGRAVKTPSKLLADALLIIASDIKRLRKLQLAKTALTDKDANTLVKYISALDAISRRQETEQLKAKKNLDKLPTDELIRMHQQEEKSKQSKKDN
jgi:hypothetical protein